MYTRYIKRQIKIKSEKMCRAIGYGFLALRSGVGYPIWAFCLGQGMLFVLDRVTMWSFQPGDRDRFWSVLIWNKLRFQYEYVMLSILILVCVVLLTLQYPNYPLHYKTIDHCKQGLSISISINVGVQSRIGCTILRFSLGQGMKNRNFRSGIGSGF